MNLFYKNNITFLGGSEWFINERPQKYEDDINEFKKTIEKGLSDEDEELIEKIELYLIIINIHILFVQEKYILMV